MWPAVVGLLVLSLVAILFGTLSARARHAGTGRTSPQINVPNSGKQAPKQDNNLNRDNPAAMELAGTGADRKGESQQRL